MLMVHKLCHKSSSRRPVEITSLVMLMFTSHTHTHTHTYARVCGRTLAGNQRCRHIRVTHTSKYLNSYNIGQPSAYIALQFFSQAKIADWCSFERIFERVLSLASNQYSYAHLDPAQSDTMSAPSMVTRAGDSLVIRSVVSGNQLFVEDDGSPAPADTGEDGVVRAADEERDLPQCKVKRNYACNLCNYFTQNPRQHLHHLRDVHKEKVKIYECSDCLYASKHFQKLARHIRIVHGKVENFFGASVANSPPRRVRKRSRRPMDEEYAEDEFLLGEAEDLAKPVVLIEADPAADSVSKTKSGAKATAATPKLKCSLCAFTTRHQGHLTRHERQDHIKTRFFRCVKCSYVTHIKARFTKHVKYHSMPMIKCDLCDFRTPYKWNLDRHYKNHNGRGAFKCCACNFTADIKQSLTVHEMNHHVPPVGQAAAAGMGVGRRRYKVGASDSAVPPPTPDSDPQRPRPYATSGAVATANKQASNSTKLAQKSRTDKLLRQLSRNTQLEIVPSREKLKMETVDLHNNPPPKKKSRPIPNLIPIQKTTQASFKMLSPKYASDHAILSPINISQKDLNELCAKSVNSSLRDFASLFDDASGNTLGADKYNDVVEITAIKKVDIPPVSTQQTLALGKKNASFFDKLKEKLMTHAMPGEGNSLTCRGCGHVAKCLSEMAGHQKCCGKYTEEATHEPFVSQFSSTRCQHCRQRCKSSTDLYVHLQHCEKATVANALRASLPLPATGSLIDEIPELKPLSPERQIPHPMENKVFVWNNILELATSADGASDGGPHTDFGSDTASGRELAAMQLDTSSNLSRDSGMQASPSTPKPATHGTNLDMASAPGGKKVFKCPHCSFWATTASRFHVHIVGHLNKKPFECSLCSYRSNWRWDITKHIRLKSVRDSAHQKARVLMTDETGRRNYSKYNKYLMQMKDSLGGLSSEKSSCTGGRKTRSSETQGNDISEVFTSLPADGRHVARDREGTGQVSPQMPTAAVTPFTSPSEANPSIAMMPTGMENAYSNTTLTAVPAPLQKKSFWKCKKCNFRDGDRQVLLQHVKEHHMSRLDGVASEATHNGGGGGGSRPDGSNDEASANGRGGGPAPFRCGHCHQVSNWKHVIQRHCRLKHNGDVRVLIGESAGSCDRLEVEDQSDDCFIVANESGRCAQCPFQSEAAHVLFDHMRKHTPHSDAFFKCLVCPFYVADKPELVEHLALHGIVQPEQFPDKALAIDRQLAGGDSDAGDPSQSAKRYRCIACPYVSNSKSQFLYHKQFHRPRGAPFQCTVCSYNVTRRHLLHQHLKVHGIVVPPQKHPLVKLGATSCGGDVMSNSDIENNIESDMDWETYVLPDIPLVWVQLDNQFLKMYKCRYCPHINLRQTDIEEHEKANHTLADRSTDREHKCSEYACTFTCNNITELAVHLNYHQGVFGVVHCLVDQQKSDEEQISQLSKLLNPTKPSMQETEVVLDPINNNRPEEAAVDRMLYFCDSCPARFLYRKEHGIHMKFHSIRLAHRCVCCTYTSRQNTHLQSHLKVHAEDYQEKTKLMQSMYPTSEKHPCPRTAILMNVPKINGPAWVVVSTSSPPNATIKVEDDVAEQLVEASYVPQKYYRCNRCPAKFFKFAAVHYHQTFHGSAHPHKCPLCDYAARSRDNLLRHQAVHDDTDSEPENVEPTVNKPPTVVPISGTELFKHRAEVQQCATERAAMAATSEAMRLATEPQLSALHVDPQFGILMHGSPEFIYPTYMKNGRMKEKRYKCHKCPSAFEKREQYKTHLTLHGAKQRYKCDYCDYSVKYYANYTQHMRKHQINDDAKAAKLKSRQNSSTDEQSDDNADRDSPAHCAIKSISPQSSRDLSQRGPLKLSVADRQTLMILQQRRSTLPPPPKEVVVDDKKYFPCPICPYNNTRRDAVENHLKRHISVGGFVSNYTCSHCDYSVPQSHFLRDHIKLHFAPLKSHRVEAYMVCDKLELWACEDQQGSHNDEHNSGTTKQSIIFKDTSDSDSNRFSPALDEQLADENSCELSEDETIQLFVHPVTGEPIRSDSVINESKEAKEPTKLLVSNVIE